MSMLNGPKCSEKTSHWEKRKKNWAQVVGPGGAVHPQQAVRTFVP